MDFNGHFRNKAYNSVRWACLIVYILLQQREKLDLILIDEASADRLFRLAEKEGTIQYGYRTWGTHARVFS